MKFSFRSTLCLLLLLCAGKTFAFQQRYRRLSAFPSLATAISTHHGGSPQVSRGIACAMITCASSRQCTYRGRSAVTAIRNQQLNNYHAFPMYNNDHFPSRSTRPLSVLPATNNDDDLEQQQGKQSQSTGDKILSLAVPALAGLAIDPLMTIADTAFVGRYAVNSAELAGIGSAAAILTFSFYIFNFLTTATTPLVASRRADDEAGALAVGGQALSLAVILGVTLAGTLVCFSQPLLQFIGTSLTGEEANGYATSFLTIRAFSAPAVFLSSASIGILRGYLDTKTPLVILAAANLVNLLLDIILIPGLGMGPTGAAIATTTAEWISAIAFLGVLAGNLPSADGDLGRNQLDKHGSSDDDAAYIRNKQEGESDTYSLLRVVPTLSIPSWTEIKPLIVASSSVFLRTFVLQLGLSGAAAMAARGGIGDADDGGAAASVAAHQIALQLWLLCSFVCDALAAASQALIADSSGRKDTIAVRDISKVVFWYSLLLGVVLAALLTVGDATGFLLGIFTKDLDTKAALSPLLVVLIATQPLNALVFTADGVLQGASEFTYQAKSMVLSVGVAVASFIAIENIDTGYPKDTLLHVWEVLAVLQLVRLITSFVKILDTDGPIDLLGTEEVTPT